MMNALALFLVFTSLVTTGVLAKDDVAVKEGHTGVLIEFEKDDGNTKVSISPKDSQHEKGYATNVKEELSGKMEEAKDKIEEASSSAHQEEETHHRVRPRELMCDAYGKCKHKIASAMGKAKEAVVETAHEAADKVYTMEEEAKEAVGEAVGKVKDRVTDAAYKASDKAHQVKDAATQVSSKAKDKASEMKQGAKERVYDVIDTTKKAKEEAKANAFKKMEGAKDKAEELVGSASDRVKHSSEEGEKGLKGIFQRAGGVLRYVASLVRMDSVAGVLHLLGFAAAYGMGLWVTFGSNYVLAGALPRYQFAMVQSKIYPVYFKAMAYSVGTALLGHLMSQRNRFWPLSMGMLLAFNLTASLVMTLVNLLYLEPRATKVMFERMKKEKEEGRGRAKEGQATGRVVETTTETAAGRGPVVGGATTTEEATPEKQEDAAAEPEIRTKSSELLLRRLHSYSSLLNVVTLMSLTWHLVCLAQRLHTVC
ncbi:Transmembrane protein [Sesamum alatum]|uniref:Transmembrane protein n=1 Tax=Sesamum alatum TaxID=300844 RepID=A0AAE1YPP5_9LAMI|nr:Transmembrane protein [Sesamum alatum]